MSLTSALNSASAGLSYTSKWAQTAAGNIANADNESYARREMSIVTTSTGEPVVSDIRRAVDASLDKLWRRDNAEAGTEAARAEGLALYTTQLGATDDAGTILARLTDFRDALGLLSATPSDGTLQTAAVTDAEQLAGSLRDAAAALGDAELRVEEDLTADLAAVNGLLSDLDGLNDRILRSGGAGEAGLNLADQMAAVLDQLSGYMDLRTETDAVGRVTLATSGGTEILSRSGPATLTWTGGQLRADGIDITPGMTGVRGVTEGSIAGRIDLLNDTFPAMADQLDEVARALVEGFAAADASLAPGQAGLFLDPGAAAGTGGLAGRIAVNPDVVSALGGDASLLRDGLGGGLVRESGDSTQINAFIALLDREMSFDPAAGLGSSDRLSGYVATLMASHQDARASAEEGAAARGATADAVRATRLSYQGINIDDELQQLVAIEQSYAANAQVLSVVNEMINTLLEAF